MDGRRDGNEWQGQSRVSAIFLPFTYMTPILERLRVTPGLGCFAGRALDRNLVMSSENFGT